MCLLHPASVDDFARYCVDLDDNLDNLIVVDGVPVIDKSKLERLLAKISKEFTKKGAPVKPENIFVPWDESTGKSKGYAKNLSPISLCVDHPIQLHIHRSPRCRQRCFYN